MNGMLNNNMNVRNDSMNDIMSIGTSGWYDYKADGFMDNNMDGRVSYSINSRLELLRRAKTIVSKLADGVDPITAAELPDDTVLNNVRISRCFYFIADILQEVIDNGGKVGGSAAKSSNNRYLPPFYITNEEKSRIEVSQEPIQISRFCAKINDVVNIEKMRKLKVTAFGKWLVEKGYLELIELNNEKHKKATALGESIGIASEFRSSGYREYYGVMYNSNAQQFLLDHLDEIIAISNGQNGETASAIAE